MMMGMAKKYFGASSGKRTWLLRIVAAALAVYGVFAFVQREIGSYMFLKNEFVLFNFDKPLILFFLDYIAVMGLFVCIGHSLTALLKGCNRKRKAK